MTPWYKQKTTWTAITGAVAAIGGYLTGECSMMVCIGSCFGALAVIFGRQGVEKSGYARHADRWANRGETPEGCE
jgi:hypothetical protein